MITRLLKTLVAVAILVALGSALAPDHQVYSQTTTPVFEPATCGFYVRVDQPVECGYLSVPEDRSDPDSPTIRLHVAIFGSISEEPLDDPVVFLAGGPGGGPGSNESAAIALSVEQDYYLFVEHRNLIVMDQRGTGHSEPLLDCPAVGRLPYDTIGEPLTTESWINHQRVALDTCHAEALAQGADLSTYTTAAMAADVEDLRLALGYEQWNLYGVGYGTRLALEVMRHYPDGLRSVILDSPIPPDAAWLSETPARVAAGLDELFTACLADMECALDFSFLEDRFYEIVARLDAEPVTMTVLHPFTQQPYEMLLDGQRFLDTIRWSLYFQDNLQFLPFIIDSAAAGHYEFVRLFAEQSLARPTYISEVAHYAVLCNEQVPFDSREALDSALATAPEATQDYLSREATLAFDICESWGLNGADTPPPAPVSSDVRTLILSGSYDSISSPDYAAQTAATLSDHVLFEFPDQTYDLVFSLDTCPLLVTVLFLNDPTTDPQPDCFVDAPGVNFLSRENMIELQGELSEAGLDVEVVPD